MPEIFPLVRSSTINASDLVFLYFEQDAIMPVVVNPGQDMHNRHGVFSHDNLIGSKWGSKVYATNGKGFAYALRPTPELWTKTLPHRTQILYNPDISFITTYLDLRPGSKVIEAGTGSGSFSHAVARVVGPNGRLYSFEFHQERFFKAREEFETHGLLGRVSIQLSNVCRDGFGLTDCVDAVFLDLPAPWEAIPFAKSALRTDRATRICCFSPCIEQVIRTVNALRQEDFSCITMFETLTTDYEQTTYTLPRVDDAIPHIYALEQRKEHKRNEQVRKAAEEKEANAKTVNNTTMTPMTDEINSAAGEEEDSGVTGGTKREGECESTEEKSTKKVKLDIPYTTTDQETETLMDTKSESEEEDDGTVKSVTPTPPPPKMPASQNKQKNQLAGPKLTKPKAVRRVSVKPSAESARGHTSYLTFALLVPASYRPSSAS